MSKEFHLSYSHQLDHLPDGHQCARLHGHNAIVRVTLAAPALNPDHFILDYGNLAPLKEWLDTELDHRHLNDVLDFPTTAERLALHVYQWCRQQGWSILEASWSETPKTWAHYRLTAPVSL